MEAVWENPHFTGVETAILVRLAKHANKQGGSIHPGVESLSVTTGFNRRSVLRVISDAKSRGILIQIGHHGRHPIYTMLKDAVISFSGDTQSLLEVTESHPTDKGQVTQSHFMGDTQSRSSDTQSPSIERARPAHERSSKGQEEKNKNAVLEFDGHKEFHQIDGVDSDTCDERCQRLAAWVEKNPALAPFVVEGAGAVADRIHFDPEGGKRSRPAKPWFYEGPKGTTRYSDIVKVVQGWTRRRGAEGPGRNGRRAAAPHMGNTVEDVAAAEREVRGGNR